MQLPAEGAVYLGELRDRASGVITVFDGFGQEVPIHPGETKSFPIKLDDEDSFYWRCAGTEARAEGFLETAKTTVEWQGTNFITAVNSHGAFVSWSCYLCQQPESAPLAARVAQPSSGGPRSLAATAAAAAPVAAPGAAARTDAAAAAAAAAPVLDRGEAPHVASRAVRFPEEDAYRAFPPEHVYVGVREGQGPQDFPSAGGATVASSSQGMQAGDASAMLQELQDYVRKEPHRLHAACFAGGCAVVLHSLLGALNFFSLVGHLMDYVVNGYMLLFGCITCLAELHPGFAAAAYTYCQPYQAKLHHWAQGLTTLWGRGLFYVFQSSLLIVSSGYFSIGDFIGLYLFGVGFFCLNAYWNRSFNVQEDYIRVI